MTSIEFLASQLGEHIIWEEKIINLIEQAKEMHKKELAQTFEQSRQAFIFKKDMPPVYETFEQYYQETFKN